MKKWISLALVLSLCMGLCACGGGTKEKKETTAEEKVISAPERGASVLPENVQMYVPMGTVETGFGEVTIVDAAFCAKSQLYLTKSTVRHKTTVNGKTTETYKETIHPGYMSAMEDRVIFALKTVIHNQSDAPVSIPELPVTVQFQKDIPLYFSKGANVQISEEAAKTIFPGTSAEVILACMVPMEQYLAAENCLLDLDGSLLGFDWDTVQKYVSLGYQEADNVPTTMDVVLQTIAENAVPVVTEAATEPKETEPEPVIEMTSGVNKKDGSTVARGRGITVKDVALGFSDTLPRVVTTSYSYETNASQWQLKGNQIYAVIRFALTNESKEEMKIVDIDDKFIMQLDYDNGYIYDTNSDTRAFFVMGDSYGSVTARSTSVGTGNMSLAPLSSAEVTAYIPCAPQVRDQTDKPLEVMFIAKLVGNESHIFTIR